MKMARQRKGVSQARDQGLLGRAAIDEECDTCTASMRSGILRAGGLLSRECLRRFRSLVSALRAPSGRAAQVITTCEAPTAAPTMPQQRSAAGPAENGPKPKRRDSPDGRSEHAAPFSCNRKG